MDLEDFREQTGIDLEPGQENEEVDTLGGLVVALLGRLPQRGEIVRHPSGLEFQVLEADPRRVKRLRLRQPQPASKPANPPWFIACHAGRRPCPSNQWPAGADDAGCCSRHSLKTKVRDADGDC